MRQFVVVVLGIVPMFGCAASHDVGEGVDTVSAELGPVALDQRCRDEVAQSPRGLPAHLSCTGLYGDSAQQLVADGVEGFTPGYLLWSDGLSKSRYLYLPPNTAIDASDPDEWTFPVGTRVWKEFRAPADDQRVETRLYYKKASGDWRQTSYQWNDALTDADRVDAARDVDLGTQVHWIPGPNDCEECHKGRRDRLLGFEQAALGLPKAEGLTLEQLVAAARIENLDGDTSYHIGADDESAEAHALGFLHMNCGVSCHNNNGNSKGYSTRLRLALDPLQLDGRPTAEFESLTTTVNVTTRSVQWTGRTRIVPGQPDESFLYTLMTQRGDPKQQMPPLGSRLVDRDDSAWVQTWIEELTAD